MDLFLASLLTAAHFGLAILSAGHALLFKRDPRAASGWIALSLLVPFFGPLAYFVFGINRVRTAAKAYRAGSMIGFERPERRPSLWACASPADALSTVGATVTQNPMLSGNAVQPLFNGEGTYPAMLGAIREATDFVHLATYIFETGEVGREFVAALGEAVDRGVDVRVLLDGVGQHYAWPSAARPLRRAGVDVRLFLPVRLIPPSLHLNLRNHRKVLVVDGKVGFTGGINIGARHVAGPDGERDTNDVHFRMRGAVVAELDEVFCHDWFFVTKESLPPAPVDTRTYGDSTCRLIVDGPDENMYRMAMVMQGVVSAAQRRIVIVTPYFLPSRSMIAALQAAATRGVDVRIVLPERNNLPFVHWATRNMLWELLLWDIKVCYQPAPFNHAKLMLIDDDYALIGSANVDPRSLRLNFELGVEVFDSEIVRALDAYLDEPCRLAKPVTLEEVDARPLLLRLRDSLFWLASPYL